MDPIAAAIEAGARTIDMKPLEARELKGGPAQEMPGIDVSSLHGFHESVEKLGGAVVGAAKEAIVGAVANGLDDLAEMAGDGNYFAKHDPLAGGAANFFAGADKAGDAHGQVGAAAADVGNKFADVAIEAISELFGNKREGDQSKSQDQEMELSM